MYSDIPYVLSKWLPPDEFWYNNIFHSATQMTLYDERERENMVLILRFLRAEHKMEHGAYVHTTDRNFEIGDFVFIKLHLYRQKSHVTQKQTKNYYQQEVLTWRKQ
ncbi:hypothetical protein V2J09_006479 [Rumex salicifolius]